MATKKYLDLDGLTRYDGKIKQTIPTKTSDLTNDSGFITDSKVVVIEYGSNIEEASISNYLNNGYAVFCKYTANNIRNSFCVPLCRRYYDTKPGYVIFEGFYGSGNKCIRIKCEFTTSSTCTWNYNEKDLQEELVSGTNIKTIDNQSLLGNGNISISGGSATDVQINGTSIVSSDVANIITESAYNSSTNKIATMSDIPAFVTTNETLCTDKSLNANSQINATDVSITKSGYKPLGIMGYSMTGTNHQSTNIIILDLTASNNGSGTIQYRFRNLSASANATITLTAKVLWLRV